jgi:non-ribosomal peptide synthetase component E (peptide arylation enzyme)
MSRRPSSVTLYVPGITELACHPDVLEVSVVGREHPKWGERAMAFVILRTESARRWDGKHAEFSSALKAHARERLPGFATPEWVVIVEELPVCPFRYARPRSVFKQHHTRKRRRERS